MAGTLPDTLRYTKFWGVSWAHDGSGVYYSRYPAAAPGSGDDAAKLGALLPQARHELRRRTASSTRSRTTPRACPRDGSPRTVITSSSRQVDGYEKNGVELPGPAQARRERARRSSWTGTRSTTSSVRVVMSCYFHTTWTAPLGQVIAVDAHQAPSGARWYRKAARPSSRRATWADAHRRAATWKMPTGCAYL